jgi:hypothetical protein
VSRLYAVLLLWQEAMEEFYGGLDIGSISVDIAARIVNACITV